MQASFPHAATMYAQAGAGPAGGGAAAITGATGAAAFSGALQGLMGGTSAASAGISAVGATGMAGPAFPQLIGDGLRRAMATQYTGEAQSVQGMAEKTELHELVTAVANAELTLSTVVAIRDRVVSAYNDILKMPI